MRATPKFSASHAKTVTGNAHESPSDFIANLPAELTEAEQDLRDAVLAFLGAWAEEHQADETPPNLVHLGANDEVRACQAEALPSNVPMKLWLRERLSQDVAVEGQSIVLA